MITIDSIIQKDKEHCFICGGNGFNDPLDKHHIFGANNRNKSEQYGLFVYIHHNKCHIFGKNAVHQNAKVNNRLKALAQHKAMNYYGWSEEDFIKIFGKNYL